MNLLYFAPHQVWPTNTGARLRDYQLARQLAARASVTFVEMRLASEAAHVLPSDSGFERVVTLSKDRTYSPSKILRGLAGPIPITILNCCSPQSAAQLAEVLREGRFDAVQIEGVPLMEYLPVIQKAPGSPTIVVDWHNVESEMMWRYSETTGNWARKIAAKRTAKLIERAEARLLDSSVSHTVTSEREREKLLAIRPDANVQVIPNGVDIDFYTAKKIAEARNRSGYSDSKKSILFVGSMDYHANIDAVTWFAREVWPQIARNHPELHFTIVGRDPASEVRALGSNRIHVTGTVDDVRPFYSSAVAAVVPIRSGSGTRLKILEAMAAGVPIVSTPLGAEGIDAQNEVHLLLAESGPEIVAAIGRVASSDDLRTRLSMDAREFVCKNYDWSIIGMRLYGIHADLGASSVPRCLQKVS